MTPRGSVTAPGLVDDLELASAFLKSEPGFADVSDRLHIRAVFLRERLAFLRGLKDERMRAWRLQVLSELEMLNSYDPGAQPSIPGEPTP